jgi:YHS domain-containing protein
MVMKKFIFWRQKRMGPLRLALLVGLGYIAWKLLRNLIREKIHNELQRTQGGGNKEAEAEDVLEEDPVCHTLIPRHQAVRLRCNGRTYYFCSEKCCDMFISQQKGPAA